MWSPEVETRIKRQAAKGVDILVVDTTALGVSEIGLICKQLGYKPRQLLQTESKTEWYQWWYLPKKRQPRIDPVIDENTKFSARREGLVPMKG